VISHSQHHKHAYYVIRNSDRLVGFNDAEIELVAQIARYHRRSAPKASHVEWAALAERAQRVVRVAAGLLRLAIGLDRSHRQSVVGVRATIEAKGDGSHAMVLAAVPADPADDLALELYATRERTGLIADALGCSVTVTMAEPG
jgi:exopolyphosphatase/guanosine-5'-triphosphate,3'-diphosphate pyrophosphatase